MFQFIHTCQWDLAILNGLGHGEARCLIGNVGFLARMTKGVNIGKPSVFLGGALCRIIKPFTTKNIKKICYKLLPCSTLVANALKAA